MVDIKPQSSLNTIDHKQHVILVALFIHIKRLTVMFLVFSKTSSVTKKVSSIVTNILLLIYICLLFNRKFSSSGKSSYYSKSYFRGIWQMVRATPFSPFVMIKKLVFRAMKNTLYAEWINLCSVFCNFSDSK